MKKLLLVSFLVASLNINAEVIYKQYTVKKGDTLSEILYEHGIKPLYTKDGSVNSAFKINRLNNNSTKELVAGDVLMLPVEVEPSVAQIEQKVVTIQSSEKEVVYRYPRSIKGRNIGEFKLWGSSAYRSSDVKFGGNKTTNELYNNYALSAEVIFNASLMVGNSEVFPFIGGQFETIENAKATINGSPSEISFDPTYRMWGGIQANLNKSWVRPVMYWEFEQFSNPDLMNGSVGNRRNSLSWFGFGLNQRVEAFDKVFEFRPRVLRTFVSSSEYANGQTDQGLDGWKLELSAWMYFNANLYGGLGVSSYELDNLEEYSLTRVSADIGYLF